VRTLRRALRRGWRGLPSPPVWCERTISGGTSGFDESQALKPYEIKAAILSRLKPRSTKVKPWGSNSSPL
jgi:hypothetical protein